MEKKNLDVVSVLTTTVLPADGVYRVETLEGLPSVKSGVPHYVGHPATAGIVEGVLGAVKAPSNLFSGLLPGEAALVVSIKQGRSSRSSIGKTVDQDVSVEDLSFRVLTRIE
jgi:hypothetical protein